MKDYLDYKNATNMHIALAKHGCTIETAALNFMQGKEMANDSFVSFYWRKLDGAQNTFN